MEKFVEKKVEDSNTNNKKVENPLEKVILHDHSYCKKLKVKRQSKKKKKGILLISRIFDQVESCLTFERKKQSLEFYPIYTSTRIYNEYKQFYECV